MCSTNLCRLMASCLGVGAGIHGPPLPTLTPGGQVGAVYTNHCSPWWQIEKQHLHICCIVWVNGDIGIKALCMFYQGIISPNPSTPPPHQWYIEWYPSISHSHMWTFKPITQIAYFYLTEHILIKKPKEQLCVQNDWNSRTHPIFFMFCQK